MNRCYLQRQILHECCKSKSIQLQLKRFVWQKNHYEVLGVKRDATIDEIKLAFKQKCKELHPDVNPHLKTHDKFIEVKKSYDILSTEKSRQEYDRSLGIGRGAQWRYKPPLHRSQYGRRPSGYTNPYDDDQENYRYHTPYDDLMYNRHYRAGEKFRQYQKEKHDEDMYYALKLLRWVGYGCIIYVVMNMVGYISLRKKLIAKNMRAEEIKMELMENLWLKEQNKSKNIEELKTVPPKDS